MNREPTPDLTRPNSPALNAIVGLHLLESLAQTLALLAISRWLDLDLDTRSMWAIVAIYATWNIGTAGLLLLGRLQPVGSRSIFVQLLAEVAVLTGLLYLSGGSTNPFVSLYLVPISLCATILRERYTIALATISIGAYSALMRWCVPLPALQVGHIHNGMNLHIAGMWVNFIVSTIVVLVFISLLVRLSRHRAEQLALLREQAIRNEQVVTMGSIAATAAHSMSTPLSTVKVILDELAGDIGAEERRENIELAHQQIGICRSSLTELLAAGGIPRLNEAQREPLRAFLDSVLTMWLTTRPDSRLRKCLDRSLHGVSAVMDPTLRHSIVNLLNNAADANRESGAKSGASIVTFTARLDDPVLTVIVEDRGPGPPRDLESVEFTSTKPAGMGVGLLLTHANIGRMGGAIHLEDLKPGCRVTIRVPLVDSERIPP